MRDSVLKRYALAYIKENGSDNGVQEFLRFRGMQNIENWSDKIFEDTYKSLSINQRISIKILDSTGSKDEKKVYNRFKR